MGRQPCGKIGLSGERHPPPVSYNRILSVADFQKWLYLYGVGHPVRLMILRNGTEYLMTDYVNEKLPQWAKPK